MENRPKDNRCQGKTKSGKPCSAAATTGGLCYFHANPKKASELGQIGGRKNRHVQPGSADPLPPLDSAQAVRDTVARLIADVYSGKLSPRIATGLAPLLNLQLRVIDTTDVQRRLRDLERQSAAEHQKRDLDSELEVFEPDREDLGQPISDDELLMPKPIKDNDGEAEPAITESVQP
jgi:Family of unknown function (DUF5763)